MTELSGTVQPPAGAVHEDRTLPAVVYALYAFNALAWGLPALIGLFIAYANLNVAGPKTRSHHVFQIRTVWMAAVLAAVGGAMIVVGLILSAILVGLPLIQLGFVLLMLIYVWVIVRCVAGVLHLSQDQAYPRPRTWLV
jgi:uncharacterized membrane protein